MALHPGTHLGRYEILSLLGAGGMGEVYRAYDPRLGREVAIKVLSPAFSSDAERLNRFEQEAQAAGSLNHPNILIIYDVDTHNGSPYVASELLEGKTLREQLSDGALPQRKAIDYALQIAHGLAAAHDRGIIHRDLKPENIFLTKDGRVKILDFGLAKLREPPRDTLEAQTDVPTRRINTDPGAVLGTAGYMSPEQVRGQRVDQRSDIFSFGCVLYEMLSGTRAFRGESQVETLNLILKEDPPDLSGKNSQIYPALERLVRHCLEKSPDQRFRSAHDLAFALETLSGTAVGSGAGAAVPIVPPHRAAKTRERVIWIGLTSVLLLLLAAALAALYLRRSPVEIPAAVTRFVIATPEKVTGLGQPLVSPDGSRVIFRATDASGQASLWLRALNSLDEPRPLAGTEDGAQPFWSPDSRSVGFFAGGKLKKIDISGGLAQTLCDATATAGGTWGRDRVIVFANKPADVLYRLPDTGGAPAFATVLDKSRNETSHVWPYFLPDGRHFLYLARSAQRERSAIFVGSLDSEAPRLLLNVDSSMAYAPPGYLLFMREEMLMAQSFDAEHLQLSGEAIPIAEHVGFNPVIARAMFSVSETGVLVYRSPTGSPSSQLTWFDRSGKQLGTVGELGGYAGISLSPDGQRVALQRFDKEKLPRELSSDIWLIVLAHGTTSRLTFDPAPEGHPIWSPDGSRIAFASTREGMTDLYQKLVSGVGNDELLLKSDERKFPCDWSPDGRHLLYSSGPASTGPTDLWVLPLFEGQKPVPFLKTAFSETDGRFSPDGRWVAYSSDESGKVEIYVQSFQAAGGQWQVSNGGGSQPRWRRDGRELFYISGEKVMAVEVDGSGDTFKAGSSKPLFEQRIALPGGPPGPHYDVTADGQRFLINKRLEQTSIAWQVTVVTNWTAQVKR